MPYYYIPYLPTKGAFEMRRSVFPRDATDLQDTVGLIQEAFKAKRFPFIRGYVVIRPVGTEEDELKRFTCPYEMVDLVKLYEADKNVTVMAVTIDSLGRFIYGKY